MTIKNLFSILLFSFISNWALAQNTIQSKDSNNENFEFRAVAELGFLSVIDHKVQFSNSGTYFDYRKNGGQDVLFPVSRFSLEFEWKKRNTFFMLYQPLRIESQVLLQDDLVVDDLTFEAGSSVKLLYGFPFYRASYLRELMANNDKYKFGIGGSLQLRNATISFESADGTKFRTNRDVGPVPALKIRTSVQLNDRAYAELEADGIYAPVSYLNGSDNEVVGAILDASLRAGYSITEPVNVFLNLRYLGGGAVGTSEPDGPGDGYVRNWLNFMTVSAGVVHKW